MAAYYYFKFHSYLENIKHNYTAFNPDESAIAQTKYDFDIDKTIQNLQYIRGKINLNREDTKTLIEVSLLQQDEPNYLRVLSLEPATKVIDYVWDNAFKYL